MAVWPLGGPFFGTDCPKWPFLGPKTLFFLAGNQFFVDSLKKTVTIMTVHLKDNYDYIRWLVITYRSASRRAATSNELLQILHFYWSAFSRAATTGAHTPFMVFTIKVQHKNIPINLFFYFHLLDFKCFCKVWWRTSIESRWLRQSWPQGRDHKCHQSWRWSRARSSWVISQTLQIYSE